MQVSNDYTREETSVSILYLFITIMSILSDDPRCICVTADMVCACLNTSIQKTGLTDLSSSIVPSRKMSLEDSQWPS